MKNKIIFLIIFFIVINGTNLVAQWKIYNSKNSPISDWVTIGNIDQDNQGNFWIYNEMKGLKKFDGFNWETFDNLIDTYGIGELFLPMASDSTNNIWWGIPGGLLLYDGKEYDGYLFRIFSGYNSILPKGLGNVQGIVVDKNNVLWLATRDKGILKFDVNKNEVIEFNISNTPLTSNTINDIVLDRNGNLWGLCGSSVLPPDKTPSLFKYDWNTWTIYSRSNSGFSVSAPLCLAIDSNDNIWIGGAANLEKFDGIKWTNYQDTVKGSCKKMSWDVVDIDVDKNNNLWVSTVYGECGLFKFDGNNWTNFNTDNSPLPDDHIMCTYVDPDNKIWIGLGSGGLAVYDNELVAVEELESYDNNFSIMPNPAEDKIKLSLRSAITNDVKISISNYMGNTVKEFNLNVDALQKSNEADLDVSDLPSGLYFATIRSGGQVQTEKFVISR